MRLLLGITIALATAAVLIYLTQEHLSSKQAMKVQREEALLAIKDVRSLGLRYALTLNSGVACDAVGLTEIYPQGGLDCTIKVGG